MERNAFGEFDGSNLSWGVKGGYGFTFGDWMVEPFGRIDWIQTQQDGVTEYGAVLGAGFVYSGNRGWNAGIRLDARLAGNATAYGPDSMSILRWRASHPADSVSP